MYVYFTQLISTMAEEEQALVKIGAETFSIAEIPASGTLLVEKQKNLLLGSVDLPSLVTDLGRVGNFIRIAYNGVAGFTDLQIKIRGIGYDITKLCDKSAVTVAKFKQASGSILGDLQGTYQFLLDALEDMALETLSAVSDVAKDMAAAANQLHNDFDEESKRVEEALKDTMRTKGSEEKRKKELELKAAELEIDKTKAQEDKKAAEQDFELYEGKYKEAEAQQRAHESSARNPLKAIGNALLSPFTRGEQVFDTQSDLALAQEARAEKLKHLEEMRKQRQMRSKALRDIAEFAKRIENCQDDSKLADIAIDALHKAMGGLQKLSVVMMKAALFWKQMQVHCEQLAKEKMKKLIVTAMKRPEEDRIRVWTSHGFKKQAVEYYAQWVALDDVCAVYMRRIQETQKELYGYLQENPTLSEARRNVRTLAITFGKELEMEQKAIAEKEFAVQKEIKDLGETHSND